MFDCLLKSQSSLTLHVLPKRNKIFYVAYLLLFFLGCLFRSVPFFMLDYHRWFHFQVTRNSRRFQIKSRNLSRADVYTQLSFDIYFLCFDTYPIYKIPMVDSDKKGPYVRLQLNFFSCYYDRKLVSKSIGLLTSAFKFCFLNLIKNFWVISL